MERDSSVPSRSEDFLSSSLVSMEIKAASGLGNSFPEGSFLFSLCLRFPSRNGH
jgi:hypothetical protein